MLVVAENVRPKYFAMMILWCEYFKMQNTDMKVYVWKSTRQENSVLCKQGDNMFIVCSASKGRGHLVLHEGRESSFGSKKQGSIVKLETNRDGATYWRNLDPNEHKTIGLDAVDI